MMRCTVFYLQLVLGAVAAQRGVDADVAEPMVSWGTSPMDCVPVDGKTPDPSAAKDETSNDMP